MWFKTYFVLNSWSIYLNIWCRFSLPYVFLPQEKTSSASFPIEKRIDACAVGTTTTALSKWFCLHSLVSLTELILLIWVKDHLVFKKYLLSPYYMLDTLILGSRPRGCFFFFFFFFFLPWTFSLNIWTFRTIFL